MPLRRTEAISRRPHSPAKVRPRRRRRLLFRVFRAVAGMIIGMVVAVMSVGYFALATPGHEGPDSDHFDGDRFFNPPHPELLAQENALSWFLTREPGPWPEWIDAQPGEPPPDGTRDGEILVTFVNHSTFLIQMDGLNILLDPIWSQRTSPVSWTGPARVRPPGIRFDDLPHIDAVLISHDHYDHLDVPTLRRLGERDFPRLFVGLGVETYLETEGIGGATALDWWGEAPIEGLRMVCVPAQHFSGRGIGDRDATLWAGWVIEGPSGTLFYAGDTGFGPHFQRIHERFGALDAAILPIGAFQPAWFMGPVHMSPTQAVDAHQILNPTVSIAAHFGTFPLADDGFDEPVTLLTEALTQNGLTSSDFWVLQEGEGRILPKR